MSIVTAECGRILKLWHPFTLHLTYVPTVTCIQASNNVTNIVSVEYLKRYMHLLWHWRTSTLSTLFCVKVPRWHFHGRYELSLSNSNACYAKIDTRLRMTQQRPRVRIKKKLYFYRNILDISIDITYIVLGILQVWHISICIYNK